MKINEQEYQRMAKQAVRPSPVLKNCIFAFLVGGSICTAGQLFFELYCYLGMQEKTAYTVLSLTLIFFGVVLTGFGVYDKMSKVGGAGTLVPITGFANAVSACAIEFKTEGLITGLSAKIFVIAGPVIVYGISASVIYGIILFLFRLWGWG